MKFFKGLIAVALSICCATLVLVGGCGAGPSKIAFIPDGNDVNDDSFNEACWNGVVNWCSNNSVSYAAYPLADTATEGRIAKIDAAVKEGADVIVLAGSSFGVALITAQDRYPSVKFVAIDVTPSEHMTNAGTIYYPAENTVCINYAEEQSGFLAGFVAVRWGYKSLAFIGGAAISPVIRYGYGFVQGCNAAASYFGSGYGVEVKYAYSGQWSASDSLTAKMTKWYQDGTEVIFACGGGIYQSVLSAALSATGNATANRKMMIGVDVDQYIVGNKTSYAYNPVLTSAMKGLALSISDTLDHIKADEWAIECGGKVLHLSLAQGNFVGLPTAQSSWRVNSSFTLNNYNDLVNKVKIGEFTIKSDSSDSDLSSVSFNNLRYSYYKYSELQVPAVEA